jgi:hypothetical protein
MSDEVPLIPVVPQGLREAAQRGKLIPFVGAGASVLAGCPTWAQLADGALAACIAADKFTHGQMDQIRHLTPRMKISIARAVEAEHGLKIDYSKLVNPRDGYKNNEVGQRVYRSLGKLSETFVTTNYDAWLDNEIPDTPLSISASPRVQDTAATPRVRRRIVSAEEFIQSCLELESSSRRGRRSEDLATVADDYWLKEMLNLYARELGKKAGAQAVLIFEKGLRTIYSDERRSYGSSLWRPAIESNSQNRDFHGPENRFVEGLRDVLDGWLETAPNAAGIYIGQALKDGSEIIRRIALHAVTEHFEVLRPVFEPLIAPATQLTCCRKAGLS